MVDDDKKRKQEEAWDALMLALQAMRRDGFTSMEAIVMAAMVAKGVLEERDAFRIIQTRGVQ